MKHLFTKSSKIFSVPTFLSIDVEPDRFQPTMNGVPIWTGYDAIFELSEKLRLTLEERKEKKVSFGWYYRTDPQVQELHGRADYPIALFLERIARHEANGDYLGVHAHCLRFSPEHNLWVHDFHDDKWVEYCIASSLICFKKWYGASPLRFRSGAAYLSNKIIGIISEFGVKVDLSLEPVSHCDLIRTGIDESPVLGTLTDCRSAPRVPYKPSHNDFRKRGGRGMRSRNLLMIPLSSRVIPADKPLWWRAGSRLIHGSSGSWPEVQVLYPSVKWLRDGFWDAVSSHVLSMRRPYLSLAIRTDPANSAMLDQILHIFEELPEHPIAEHLDFIDPLMFSTNIF